MSLREVSVCFLLLFPLFAFGEENPDFTVEVDPMVYSRKDFDQKGVKTGEIPARKKRPDAIPNRWDREKVFARVPGLKDKIANMDEMDRDLLFLRARTKPLKDLAKTYPSLDQKSLARLKKESETD